MDGFTFAKRFGTRSKPTTKFGGNDALRLIIVGKVVVELIGKMKYFQF